MFVLFVFVLCHFTLSHCLILSLTVLYSLIPRLIVSLPAGHSVSIVSARWTHLWTSDVFAVHWVHQSQYVLLGRSNAVTYWDQLFFTSSGLCVKSSSCAVIEMDTHQHVWADSRQTGSGLRPGPGSTDSILGFIEMYVYCCMYVCVYFLVKVIYCK